MPSRETYILDKKTFSNLRLLNATNSVLIRMDKKNVDRKTKSGIIVVGDTDFDPHAHADRVGIVEQVPEYLTMDDMDWEAEVELQKDDVVWFDYMASLNCQGFDVDGVEYKIIKYYDIYLAMRDGKFLPINGNCLFGLVDVETVKSKFDLSATKKKDARYGIGKHMSKPNRGYKAELYYDDDCIKENIKAIFGMPPVLLEDVLHQEIKGDKLRVSQRRYILGYEESGRVYPTRNNVVIKPDKPKKVTESGLFVPLRDIKDVEDGVIIASGHKEFKRGDRVRFSPDVSGSSYVPDKKHGTVHLTRGVYVLFKY